MTPPPPPSVQIPPEKPITESAFAPALDNADMEMVNLVEVMTRQIIQETNKAVENKEMPKDPWLIALMIVGIAAYMVKNLVMPLVEKKKKEKNGEGEDTVLSELKNLSGKLEKSALNAELANLAHSIVVQKDADGIPVLLTIPKHMRETAEIMSRVSDTLEKIESHFHEK